MNILLMSLQGSGLCLASKIREEGHDLIAYIKQDECKDVGTGLVFKTEDPDEIAAQADLILFDDNSMGKTADAYREKGYKVWGGGTFADKLEYDRLYGMQVFREYGVNIPEMWEVHDLNGVKDALSECASSEKVVIKLDGSEAAGSSFTFVAKNPQACEEQVEHWIEEGLIKEWSGIVQRFVDGIEVSVEAWWDGERFTTHNITLEEKKLLSDDLGPSVGCAYNTVVRIDKESRLFELQLEPFAPLLKEKGYTGPIDVNSIVADGVPYALEFTPRLGYEATPTLAWGNNHGFVNKILYLMGIYDDVAKVTEFGYKGRIWGAVRIYVPPYPSTPSEEACCKGVPILGYEPLAEDLWLYDVMKEDEKLMCAGSSGIIGAAFGAGDDPLEASRAAYEVAERLNVPDRSWRALDGARRAQEALPQLRRSRLIKLYEALP